MSNSDAKNRENGTAFLPKFSIDGLLTGIVVHAETREVLMVAHLNQAALDATQETGLATFFSRSRQKLWRKGETSGNTLTVKAIRVDCDQDALILECDPAGPACHTGAETCFYRSLEGNGLKRI